MTQPPRTTPSRLLPILAAVVAGGLIVAGLARWVGSSSPRKPSEQAPNATAYRAADYRRAVDRAVAWADALQVDPVALQERGVKGKKKLAEALAFYATLIRYEDAPDERRRLQRRFRELAAATDRPAYHNLETCDEAELKQNSMSYMRVMWLMERAGLDTSNYRAALERAKSRLDAHVGTRGPWQQAMFASYYDDFGLEKPPLLQARQLVSGVVASQFSFEQFNRFRAYQLTHEVFVAFDYGFTDEQRVFDAADLDYIAGVLPLLVDQNIQLGNPDLLGELVASMTMLGHRDQPATKRGIDYLLDHQNPSGTWGAYEGERAKMGDLLDLHLYLHTTLAVVKALVETYERPRSKTQSSLDSPISP